MNNDLQNSTVTASAAITRPHPNASKIGLTTSMANTLAEGHLIVRQKLGNDRKKMNFDSNVVCRFRTYMATTILSTTSNRNDIGHKSSEYYDAKGSIQFCANGTFYEVLSGHVDIMVEGRSTFSSGTNYMPGHWEVAALPNGMLVIFMYSTHPRMLEDSPSGFIHIVVAEHTVDFVELPGGAGYYRRIYHRCNRSKVLR